MSRQLWESEEGIQGLAEPSSPVCILRFTGAAVSVCEGAYFMAQLLTTCFQ